jgi:phosphoglucosamine mutase
LAQHPLSPVGTEIGHLQRFADAEDRYLVHLLGTLPNTLKGLTVVLDCANGAASAVSPEAFKDAGAKVIVIGNDPDGHNINQGCGSTHLGALQAAVVEHKADIGIAHDGDADRTLAVDHTGAVVDGDQIMAILALAAKQRGDLARNTLVATVMSNLGLRLAMKQASIEMIETKVGDRYVLEQIREGGYTLGGEQSGHLIFSRFATTGDGILTGLQLAAQLAATGKSLKELAMTMKVYPQVLINVSGVNKDTAESNEELQKIVREAEADLGENGRVLLRASGTENLVRVMVEAMEAGTAQSWAERIARVVERELKLS